MTHRRAIVAVVLACLIGCVMAQACKVPVFRYALERWPADKYRIVAVSDGPVAAAITAAINDLKQSPANATVETIDLSQLSEAELWQIEGIEQHAETPMLQVFYPERNGQRKLCWQGNLSVANVVAWQSSTLRQQLAADLQSGVSAVWVIVEGNNQQANDEFATKLHRALEVSTESITIPEGVITRSKASEYFDSHPGASMDDVLRSDIPLRIDFKIIRLKQTDDEIALRAMMSSFVKTTSPPFAIPVFGRGRMIEPLSADALTTVTVLSACNYLVGQCSCTMKALNPGVDLLLSTDWQENLGNEIVLVDTISNEPTKALTIPPGRTETESPRADQLAAEKPESYSQPHYIVAGAFVLIGFASLLLWTCRRKG
ncbi:MAG: hypothetical protein WBD20_09185 [Pirellulaceae bacterium]